MSDYRLKRETDVDYFNDGLSLLMGKMRRTGAGLFTSVNAHGSLE